MRSNRPVKMREIKRAKGQKYFSCFLFFKGTQLVNISNYIFADWAPFLFPIHPSVTCSVLEHMEMSPWEAEAA